MEFKQVTREIHLVRLKFAEWRLKARTLDVECGALMEAAIGQFAQTLGELVVAYEDVERINNDLVQTQLIAALEHQRYQELFEHAPLGYLLLDRAGKIRRGQRDGRAAAADTRRAAGGAILAWADRGKRSAQAARLPAPCARGRGGWSCTCSAPTRPPSGCCCG